MSHSCDVNVPLDQYVVLSVLIVQNTVVAHFIGEHDENSLGVWCLLFV